MSSAEQDIASYSGMYNAVDGWWNQIEVYLPKPLERDGCLTKYQFRPGRICAGLCLRLRWGLRFIRLRHQAHIREAEQR